MITVEVIASDTSDFNVPLIAGIAVYSLVTISLPPSSAWLEDSQLTQRCTSTYTNAEG